MYLFPFREFIRERGDIADDVKAFFYNRRRKMVDQEKNAEVGMHLLFPDSDQVFDSKASQKRPLPSLGKNVVVLPQKVETFGSRWMI